MTLIECECIPRDPSAINRPKGATASKGNLTAELAEAILGGIDDQINFEEQRENYARCADGLENIAAFLAEVETPMRAGAATISGKDGECIEMADRAAIPPLLRAAINDALEPFPLATRKIF